MSDGSEGASRVPSRVPSRASGQVTPNENNNMNPGEALMNFLVRQGVQEVPVTTTTSLQDTDTNKAKFATIKSYVSGRHCYVHNLNNALRQLGLPLSGVKHAKQERLINEAVASLNRKHFSKFDRIYKTVIQYCPPPNGHTNIREEYTYGGIPLSRMNSPMGAPMGAPQMGPPQMGPPQMGPPQMGPPQMGPPPIGSQMGPQLGPPQLGLPPVGPQMGPQIGPPQLGPQMGPQMSPQIGSPQLGSQVNPNSGGGSMPPPPMGSSVGPNSPSGLGAVYGPTGIPLHNMSPNVVPVNSNQQPPQWTNARRPLGASAPLGSAIDTVRRPTPPSQRQYTQPQSQSSRSTELKQSVIPTNPLVPTLYFHSSPFYKFTKQIGVPVYFIQEPHTVLKKKSTISQYLVVDVTDLRPDDTVFLVSQQHGAQQKKRFIEFPYFTECYVDNTEVKLSTRGVRGVEGSAKPANLTPFLRTTFKAKPKRQIKVIVHDCEPQGGRLEKNYAMALMKGVITDTESLVLTVKQRPHILINETIQSIKKSAAEDEDAEIESSDAVYCLKDKIMMTRITLPIRSRKCTHIECFDASTFFMLQQQAETWKCPVCNKQIDYESLAMCDYFQEILKRCHGDSVLVRPDGTWTSHDEEEGNNHPPSGGSSVKNETVEKPSEDVDLVTLLSDDDSEHNDGGQTQQAQQAPQQVQPQQVQPARSQQPQPQAQTQPQQPLPSQPQPQPQQPLPSQPQQPQRLPQHVTPVLFSPMASPQVTRSVTPANVQQARPANQSNTQTSNRSQTTQSSQTTQNDGDVNTLLGKQFAAFSGSQNLLFSNDDVVDLTSD